VIIASWLGLPVSSTHIAVGAVFGVGFFREWYTENSTRRAEYVARHQINATADASSKPARSEDQRRRKLVRRSHFLQIIAAWVITVPAAAVLSGVLFVVLRAVLA